MCRHRVNAVLDSCNEVNIVIIQGVPKKVSPFEQFQKSNHCLVLNDTLGRHFTKMTLWGIDFHQLSLTWLKFWIVITILEYTCSMAFKVWGIVFAKIY